MLEIHHSGREPSNFLWFVHIKDAHFVVTILNKKIYNIIQSRRFRLYMVVLTNWDSHCRVNPLSKQDTTQREFSFGVLRAQRQTPAECHHLPGIEHCVHTALSPLRKSRPFGKNAHKASYGTVSPHASKGRETICFHPKTAFPTAANSPKRFPSLPYWSKPTSRVSRVAARVKSDGEVNMAHNALRRIE